MGQYITYHVMSDEELEKFFNKNLAKKEVESFLNKFSNVMVTVEDIAKYHNVSITTVYNYINDGLIEPEFREKKYDVYRFRLNYALTLDFKELQKKLRLSKRTK